MGDLGLIPGLGRSPGEGKGYPLQYSGLENSMDCIVHGVAKSQTRCIANSNMLIGPLPILFCKVSVQIFCLFFLIFFFNTYFLFIRASLIAQLVKNPPAMQETLVQFLGQEDPLEKG